MFNNYQQYLLYCFSIFLDIKKYYKDDILESDIEIKIINNMNNLFYIKDENIQKEKK